MEQKTLWSEEVITGDKEKIEFYKPLSSKLNHCERALLNERVTELLPKFQQIKKLFITHQPVMRTAEGESTLPDYILNIVKKKGNIPKEDLIKFISFFLADIRNFSAYFQCLDKEVQQVWRFIIEYYFASNKLLKQKTGMDCILTLHTPYYYDDIVISDKLPWFAMLKSQVSYSLRDYYLYLPRQYRQFIYPFFLNQKINSLPLLSELPEEEELQTFNEEKQIFNMLPILDNMYKQNMLQFAKNKISATSLKKTSKLIDCREFFPKDTDKNASLLRTSMLLSTYSIFRASAKEEYQPEVFIKKLLQKIIQYPGILMTLSLPHVGGLKINTLSDSYASIQVKNILQLLTSCKSELWTNVESMRLRLYGLEEECCYNILLNGPVLYKVEFTNIKQNKESILLEDLYNEISIPFIKGFLFLLASFGIVEVAYDKHEPESYSYCCSLRYVRLTPLGEYVLDIKGQYTPEISEEINFEVNVEDLIVRSISENNPYESLLTDISTPIGGHRYKITSGSFLKNCNSKVDIEYKISFFKKHVCEQPPQNWEDFFQSILQRCNPLQELDFEKYRIFQLKAEDKELQRLVSTDPNLRKYTKRGEEYLLLVEKKHLSEVISRLKSFGYLL